MLNSVLARPKLTALGLALVTLLAVGLAVTGLRVEGDVARALKGTSEAFRANAMLESRFGAPSKDEVYFVTTPDFGDPASFTALEDLVLGLQLTPGVRGVISIFTLPDPQGSGLTFLSRADLADTPPAERLDRLRQSSPLAPYMLAQDRGAVLLTVIPDLSVPAEDRLALLDAEIALADPGLDIAPVGLAALQREISAGLLLDQAVITPVATVVCLIIALLLFRSWRAAVLCVLPSLVGLGWSFGFMAVAGIAFDPFMAIVPTLVLVLGIADSVHVFHTVAEHAKTMDSRAAVARGMVETMPAVVLAGLTTALAFACLGLIGSETLASVALVGPVALALTTLAVWLVLPPAARLIFGDGRLARARPLGFAALTGATLRLLPRFRAVSVLAVAALALLIAAQSQTVIGYRLMDHVPKQGAFRDTLTRLQTMLPGSDQNFAILDAADPEPGLSAPDRALIARAAAALYGQGAGVMPDRDGPDTEAAVLRRFEAADGGAFALPVIGQLDSDWTDVIATTESARQALAGAGIAKAQITGYSLMTSIELPLVVQELRLAFYAAVALVTLLAALLLRSLRVAALSVVPNLLPILGVEAWLFLTGTPLTVIGAIAFTIAFGIAVDDTIHLLNRLRLAKDPGTPVTQPTVEAALRATAAPILTTSVVLAAGFAVTAFSILPSVSLFGQLTAAAMVLAVIADLFLFPSLLCWGAIGARTR